MRAYLFVFVLSFAGCASMPRPEFAEHQAWVQKSVEALNSGQMKRSAYFRELNERIASLPDHPGKGKGMELSNRMLSAALDVEGGRIDEERYAALLRAVQAEDQQEQERNAALAEQHRLGRAGLMPPSTYQPPLQCRRIGSRTVCQ